MVVPGATVPLHPRADQAVDVEEELETALAAVAGEADGVTINPIVTEGVPAAVLCEAAEGADLLVIGRGRHHALRKRVLGSVGTEVLQHAPCPVVVVTHRSRRGCGGRGRTSDATRKPDPAPGGVTSGGGAVRGRGRVERPQRDRGPERPPASPSAGPGGRRWRTARSG